MRGSKRLEFRYGVAQSVTSLEFLRSRTPVLCLRKPEDPELACNQRMCSVLRVLTWKTGWMERMLLGNRRVNE